MEHPYKMVMVSDLVRDGVCLELWTITDSQKEVVIAEIFYSDKDGTFQFSCFDKITLSLELLKEFVTEAMESLPPK